MKINMKLWFLVSLVCVIISSAVSLKKKVSIIANDCSNSDFLGNISTASTKNENRKNGLKVEESEFQLIQIKSSDKVKIHEVEVTRTTLAQTCGHFRNNIVHWYHELILGLKLKEPVELSENQ